MPNDYRAESTDALREAYKVLKTLRIAQTVQGEAANSDSRQIRSARRYRKGLTRLACEQRPGLEPCETILAKWTLAKWTTWNC